MKYHIEHKRELSEEEKNILNQVLSRPECRSYLDQIDSLKVIARCGCGMCPTVLFGQDYEDEPIPMGKNLVQYHGINSEGEVVGVTVMAVAGKLTELEASSFSGGDIVSWPAIKNLKEKNT